MLSAGLTAFDIRTHCHDGFDKKPDYRARDLGGAVSGRLPGGVSI